MASVVNVTVPVPHKMILLTCFGYKLAVFDKKIRKLHSGCDMQILRRYFYRFLATIYLYRSHLCTGWLAGLNTSQKGFPGIFSLLWCNPFRENRDAPEPLSTLVSHKPGRLACQLTHWPALYQFCGSSGGITELIYY